MYRSLQYVFFNRPNDVCFYLDLSGKIPRLPSTIRPTRFFENSTVEYVFASTVVGIVSTVSR